jgi:hypothetical protein
LYPQTGQVLFWYLKIITSAVTSFVDFISQLVLIYRCWHMWNRTWFMIIPAFLSLASLAGSLVLVGELSALLNTRNFDHVPLWWVPMGVTAFSLSLAVNTIVTGLLVLKIVLEYRQTNHSNYNHNHLTWRKNIVPIIAILIETGLMTFVGQMAWTISYGLQSSIFGLVAGVVIVLYGLSPTIIHVRAALGSSYEVSRVESTIHFADRTKPSKKISLPATESQQSSSVEYLESNVKETSTMEAI